MAFLYYSPYRYAYSNKLHGFFVYPTRQLPHGGRLAVARSRHLTRGRARWTIGPHTSLRRLLQMIPVVARRHRSSCFFLIHLVPGDPARDDARHPRDAGSAVALLHHEWGLDQSLPAQYELFMEPARARRPRRVALLRRVGSGSSILERLPVTLWLIGYGDAPLDADRGAARGARGEPAGRACATTSCGSCRWSASASRPSGSGSCCCSPSACTSAGCSRSAATAPASSATCTRCSCPALTVALAHLADPDPQPAREPARGARVGLHHDGPLEGPPRAARARAPRAAQRRHLDRHACSASTSATWSAARS